MAAQPLPHKNIEPYMQGVRCTDPFALPATRNWPLHWDLELACLDCRDGFEEKRAVLRRAKAYHCLGLPGLLHLAR